MTKSSLARGDEIPCVRALAIARNAAKNGLGRVPILFRRILRFTPLPSLCLLIGVADLEATGDEKRWEAPAAQAQKRNPIAVGESSLAEGRKIYFRRCAPCHGKTGNGDGPDAVDLGIHPAKLSDPKLREESDGALFWKITIGKKPMPDYGH